MKKNIAILTGGYSSEREISLASAHVVYTHLDRDQYNAFLVDISSSPWSVENDRKQTGIISMNDFSARIDDKQIHFDAVFVAIHGTPAEDGKIQGYLDLLSIPYTACSVLSSSITFDKAICKQLVTNIPVKLAQSVLCTHTSDVQQITQALSYPVFVKPNKNGSSYGVSKVDASNELEKAVQLAFTYDDEVLIEEYIDGRELACGVFKSDDEFVAFPITEIISENDFFDYEAKYEGKSEEITPAQLSKEIATTCQNIAKQIYSTLKLTGVVRIDFFLKENDLYLLEVNTIPGLSEESILPQQAIEYGWSLQTLFDKMIKECITRNK